MILVVLGAVSLFADISYANEPASFAGHTASPTGDYTPYDAPDNELTLVHTQSDSTTLATQADPDTSDQALEALVLTALEQRDRDAVDVARFNKSFQEFSALYKKLLLEHPELFDVGWTLNGTYDASGTIQTLTPTYYLNSYTDDEVFAMRKKMLQGIADAMAWIPADGSDLEKVKAAHDWMCTHVTYYAGSYNEIGSYALEPTTYGLKQDYYDVFYAHCAYGALAERSCVCQGFAQAFKLLMDQLGINCKSITSQDHEWNAVQIDGAWFVLDTTWDADSTDKVDANGEWNNEKNQIAYTYFMVSDEEMTRREHEYSGYGPTSEFHVKQPYQVESNDSRYDGYVVGQDSPWY